MSGALSSVNSAKNHRNNFFPFNGLNNSQIILTLPCRYKHNYSSQKNNPLNRICGQLGKMQISTIRYGSLFYF